MKRERTKNTVGPMIRKLRNERGWTQRELAAKLQVHGWNCTRSRLAKIEAQQIFVRDFELPYFREVFHRTFKELFPKPPLRAAPFAIEAANEETTGPPEVRPTT